MGREGTGGRRAGNTEGGFLSIFLFSSDDLNWVRVIDHKRARKMDQAVLEELMQQGEGESLDWKRDFPQPLLSGNSDPYWNTGRGTLLKDMAAIANTITPGNGHLVYGVKDTGTERIVFGISKQWDDATFQQWVTNTFDPPIKFSYAEIQWDDDKIIGVFDIQRSPAFPHVATQDVGAALCKGQVWFRRGSQNDVAGRDDLKEMFTAPEPFCVNRLDDRELVQVIQLLRDQGVEASMQLRANKDSLLAQGYEPAYYPGSRREVHGGHQFGRYEHILMVKP